MFFDNRMLAIRKPRESELTQIMIFRVIFPIGEGIDLI